MFLCAAQYLYNLGQSLTGVNVFVAPQQNSLAFLNTVSSKGF